MLNLLDFWVIVVVVIGVVVVGMGVEVVGTVVVEGFIRLA